MKKWEIVNKNTGEIEARVEAMDYVESDGPNGPEWLFVGSGDNTALLKLLPGTMGYYEVQPVS